jgi:hypothetical protein
MTPRPELKALATAIHANAVAKGFYEYPPTRAKAACLIIEEIGDFVGAHRANRHCALDTLQLESLTPQMYVSMVKGTTGEELADIVIRVLDSAEYFGENIFQNPFSHYEKYDIHELLLLITYRVNGLKLNGCEFILYSISICEEIATKLDIDLWAHVAAKMAYNQTRAYKHGKAY